MYIILLYYTTLPSPDSVFPSRDEITNNLCFFVFALFSFTEYMIHVYAPMVIFSNKLKEM